MWAVNISLTHSLSRSPQSAREVSSTKSAWNWSKFSVFFCFRQLKLYFSKAIIRVVTNISSKTVMNCCADTVSSCKLGLFVVFGVVFQRRDTRKDSCAVLRPFHPIWMNYTKLFFFALLSRGFPNPLFFLDYAPRNFFGLPFHRLSRPRILVQTALLMVVCSKEISNFDAVFREYCHFQYCRPFCPL